MTDYILLMHNDADDSLPQDWDGYFAFLRQSGAFEGGSSIGDGICLRKSGPVPDVTAQLGGYIRIVAADLDDARRFAIGNPVYMAGGTVEIRELPRD